MIIARISSHRPGSDRLADRGRRRRRSLPSLAPAGLERLEVRCVPTVLYGPTSTPPKLGTSAVFSQLADGDVQAVITNNSDSTVTVALAAYKNATATGDLNLLHQSLTDVEWAVLGAHRSVTLVVEPEKTSCNPNNIYVDQIDAYVGAGRLNEDGREALVPRSFTSLAQATKDYLGGLVVDNKGDCGSDGHDGEGTDGEVCDTGQHDDSGHDHGNGHDNGHSDDHHGH